MAMKTLNDVIGALPETERLMIDARATALIAEEKTLRDMRKALDLTQETVAEALGIKQVNVSQLEKRSDFLLSTLRKYVQAMGGELDLVAQFPGREPMRIKGLSELGKG
jgi:DNA-directed RNA polymerase specialized sigma subunit